MPMQLVAISGSRHIAIMSKMGFSTAAEIPSSWNDCRGWFALASYLVSEAKMQPMIGLRHMQGQCNTRHPVAAYPAKSSPLLQPLGSTDMIPIDLRDTAQYMGTMQCT